MAAMFSTPKMPAIQPPPPPPHLNDPKIAMAADEDRRQRAMQGRASQFMSNPQMQTQAQPDAKRYLTNEVA